MSESLHHELAFIGSPVGVSVLCPGFVRTRIHEADRNWPASSGPRPDGQDVPGSEEIRQAVSSAVESGLDPAIIATAVRDAIVGEKFWILTHPDLSAAILRRYNGAVDGLNPTSPGLT
jgi:short-subunit dehydrogenase